MKVFRQPNNPIIEPKDVEPSRNGFEVIGVFNAGAIRYKDEIILLLRVAERPTSQHPDNVAVCYYDLGEKDIVVGYFSKNDTNNDFSDSRFVVTPADKFLTSISHLRLARSRDGIHFKIDTRPALEAADKYEIYGLEDPRISLIDGVYYISYVAVSPFGIVTSLASTENFESFKRYGVIFVPDNKDVILFGGEGKYYALHRPVSAFLGSYEMWLAKSDNLLHWGGHQRIMGTRPGSWDGAKIGGAATPFKIKDGWLEIYHGVDNDGMYSLGAVLLDKNEPYRVIARTAKPIFQPETEYERKGFFGNVVFTCGILSEEEKLKIYYGAADTSLCYAEIKLKDVLENLL